MLLARGGCGPPSPQELPPCIESLDGDRGVDRRHYAVPFKGILIRSTPEIVLSSKQNNYKISEDERMAKQDDKLT